VSVLTPEIKISLSLKSKLCVASLFSVQICVHE